MPADPARFGAAGSALWEAVASTYELRPDERRILEDACREVDLIDRMQEHLRTGPLEVPGSKGQNVVNPLVSEIRQHRQVVRSLLGSLRLPDEDAGSVHGSSAARALALQRWRRSG